MNRHTNAPQVQVHRPLPQSVPMALDEAVQSYRREMLGGTSQTVAMINAAIIVKRSTKKGQLHAEHMFKQHLKALEQQESQQVAA